MMVHFCVSVGVSVAQECASSPVLLGVGGLMYEYEYLVWRVLHKITPNSNQYICDFAVLGF